MAGKRAVTKVGWSVARWVIRTVGKSDGYSAVRMGLRMVVKMAEKLVDMMVCRKASMRAGHLAKTRA